MKKKRSFGTKVLYGVLAGIAVGVFFGEYAAPLGVVGDIYVGLLQMTVLPYVTISLITKIGGLGSGEAKRLGGQAGLVMIALWALSLLVVFVMPLSLPDWEAGTFFSSSLLEEPERLDFIDLYLPVNPFHSLANNIVPAVVVFSICVGLAIIGLEGKARILEPADVAGAALGRISGAVVAASPYGTFAMTAEAAGELAPMELARLAGYVSTNTIGVLFLTFFGLPALVAAFTPFRFRGILSGFRGAGLTAFATGKLFAVLPMVIDSVKAQLGSAGIEEEDAETIANVYVPLGYPFPNAGKILAILFIPFAAWFVGSPLEIGDYPMLLTVGLLAFFGSPVAAIPFLLDLFRLPQDLFPLFLVAGIWSARLGDVVGAMHLTAFTLLCAAWSKGMLKLRKVGGLIVAGMATAVLALCLAANYLIVDAVMAGQPPSKSLIEGMELRDHGVEIEQLERAAPNPVALAEGESVMDRIAATRVLRAGYVPDRPPFCFRNGRGELVGYDIDLLVHLARGLGAKLQLVPFAGDAALTAAFGADHFDVAVGGIRQSMDHIHDYRQTRPYLRMHVGLLVPDHQVNEFRDFDFQAPPRRVRLGYVKTGDLKHAGPAHLSGVELVPLPSVGPFLAGKQEDVDAFAVPAEVGSHYTMTHPAFALVIPRSIRHRVPIVLAMRSEAVRGERYMDAWLEQRAADGTLDGLYDHWILGKQVTKKKRRWSVVVDVLGWLD